MALLATLMCGAVFLLPEEQYRSIRSSVQLDPVFRAGMLLLILLLIQWLNSGYTVVTDDSGLATMERIPWRWFPWSVDRSDAAEMLLWFFPTLVAVVVIRHLLSRRNLKVLMRLLVWNAALLAGVGIMQDLFDVDRILMIWNRTRGDSFATFDYPNHAAAWFYLHGAVAAGIAHDDEMKRKPRIRILVWSLCFLCCFAASCLTLSRFGAFIAAIQFTVILVLLVHFIRGHFRGVRAFHAYLCLAIIALVGATLFFGAGGGALAEEVGSKSVIGEQSISSDIFFRAKHVAVAQEIIREYPFFGCGGWGCDGLVRLSMGASEFQSWMVGGRANVHCDPVQFLAEFGIAGSLCIGLALASLVMSTAGARRSVLVYWVWGGLLAVFIQSLIDLPFRCPAVLLAWCCMLAAIPRLTQNTARKSGNPG